MSATTADLRLRRLILIGLAAACLLAGTAQAWTILIRQPAGLDFLPLWAAGGMDISQVYDFKAVGHAQAHWVITDGKRPYIYPPSALLLLRPMAALPFWLANLIWTGVSALAMAAVLWRALPRKDWTILALAALSPPVVVCLAVGQTTFAIAALALGALIALPKRPLLAGALLALAALLKPNLVMFAPVALIAIGAWRALGAAAVVGVIGGVLSLLLFGVQPWFEWLGALGQFRDLIANEESLLRGVIAPAGPLTALGVAGPALMAVNVAFVAGAGLMVWKVFKASEDAGVRLAALMGGALIAAPYAMQYDAALLAPAAALLLARDVETRRWSLGVAGFLLLAACGYPYVGVLALLGFVALACGPALLADSAILRPGAAKALGS